MPDTRDMQRFETHKEAMDYAKRESRKHRDVRYVIESPPSKEEPATDVGRYVVDTDGFRRSWERRIAVYDCGVLQ